MYINLLFLSKTKQASSLIAGNDPGLYRSFFFRPIYIYSSIRHSPERKIDDMISSCTLHGVLVVYLFIINHYGSQRPVPTYPATQYLNK